MKIYPYNFWEKFFYSCLGFTMVLGACFEFLFIAQGTGQWAYGFSLIWAIFFVFYICTSFGGFTFALFILWNQTAFFNAREKLLLLRKKIFMLRWLIGPIIFLTPIYMFQFTVLGIIFNGLFTRLLIWLMCLLTLSYLFSDSDHLINTHHFLFIAVLMGGAFAITAALRFVSDYPFSQSWSEGNRIWDYSVMFGRERYIYPTNAEIPVALDKGRQFVGGIPFLFTALNIQQIRAWIGLLGVIPYLLIGITLFRFLWHEKKLYFVMVLWGYVFLNQAPVYSPLILSACLTFLAWRSRTWLALILILISSYFASMSRFTWAFAPTLWLLMLETSNSHQEKFIKQFWIRLLALTSLGFIGGAILPSLFDLPELTIAATQEALQESTMSPENIISRIESQPLLWGRLLPNDTYPPGILLGLLFAIAPLLGLVLYLAFTKVWNIKLWQKNILMLFLLAFFVVGLIVSTKIGGGGDLHNMDMFFIGMLLLFTIVIVQGGKEWLLQPNNKPFFIQTLVILAVIIPGLKPLQEMRGYNFTVDTDWLMTLTDRPNEKSLDLYPSAETVASSLKIINNEVSLALEKGEVLFMDQRQLLTFGYITNVPLVPDYDKKLLIERAFSERRNYFESFYSDLKTRRFSLIIVQPLNTITRGNQQNFGDENNAWVMWVSRPMLCYYKIKQTLTEVNVQLLIPDEGIQDCSKVVP